MLQKLSMNNALDEFYQLATSNKILETNTANLIRTDLSFVTLKTFLGEKEENIQDKFLNFISTLTLC